MTVQKKFFGTDGIRGRVGFPPMQPELMVKLGWAIGMALSNYHGRRIVLGKDTRITGYMIESALESGLSAAGVDTYLLGPMPTPAIAYLTKSMEFDAGIVVSASHNPYYDNGIKIFSNAGTKISDELECKIEELLGQPMAMVASENIGRVYRVDDAIHRYVEFCKAVFPVKHGLAGLKLVVDCANGANYYIGPRVFNDLGAEIITLANAPNGLNINAECGSTHTGHLQQAVKDNHADAGIAFDGDGDRLIMVDKNGEVVDGDELLLIIAKGAQREGKLQGGVVGTLMSNFGLELALQAANIPFMRTQVGDRYVLEALQKEHWQIGGEASGHIIHLGYSTSGDAIIAALLVLAEMYHSGEPLHVLKQQMQKHPQQLINVRVKQMVDPLSIPAIKSAVDTATKTLGQRGRVLIRASGTEPLIRVMVEGLEAEEVDRIAKQLTTVVEESV